MRNNLVETLVGAAVLFVTFSFLYFAFNNSSTNSAEGSTYLATFDKTDGLSVGADVKISGITVGIITDHYLNTETFGGVVEINIDSSIKLPEDTFAKITAEGLLGGNYLVLDPGGSDIILQSGDEIMETQGSVDLLGLLDSFVSSGDSK
jgi:phospholipid/cholesterol/gamma-HCH transport system substrate-binding protein